MSGSEVEWMLQSLRRSRKEQDANRSHPDGAIFWSLRRLLGGIVPPIESIPSVRKPPSSVVSARRSRVPDRGLAKPLRAGSRQQIIWNELKGASCLFSPRSRLFIFRLKRLVFFRCTAARKLPEFSKVDASAPIAFVPPPPRLVSWLSSLPFRQSFHRADADHNPLRRAP